MLYFNIKRRSRVMLASWRRIAATRVSGICGVLNVTACIMRVFRFMDPALTAGGFDVPGVYASVLAFG
jgi:hypothetical protein